MTIATRRASGLLTLCALSLAGVLLGCTPAAVPGSATEPVASPVSTPSPEPLNTSEYGGEGAPVPSDGSEVTVPTAPAAEHKTSTITKLVVAEDDYSGLDWHVTCSGLDASPTVIATATADGKKLTVVLLGSSTEKLNSFTLSIVERGNREDAGLNVHPQANQGNGSLAVRDHHEVTSTGRGMHYGADVTAANARVIYEFTASCAIN